MHQRGFLLHGFLPRLGSLFLVALFCLSPAGVHAQRDAESRSWNRPVKPFRIIGNVYYVGASEVSSYLITTPQGHILLDSGFAETVPLVRAGIQQLGFKLEDVKLLINSHAHYDHAGGLAELKSLTGAKLAASEADAAQLAVGGKGDFRWGDALAFAPVRADRLLRDGDTVALGGVTMVAHLTPGHTKGNTTWTMAVKEGGKTYNVVFMGSTSAPGYQLVDNPNYPNIVADYQRSFRLLKSLPCDVFLAPHGSFFGLTEKMAKLEQGTAANPFIDPQGYRDFLEGSEQGFYEQLKKQQAKPSQ
jgi:metallo-beta-lactamase class B